MAGTSMPAGFGGLMRYNEEYETRFKLKPSHVVGFVMLIILFAILLRIFFPIA
jgi:preprotein translocase subunit Sec61beta